MQILSVIVKDISMEEEIWNVNFFCGTRGEGKKSEKRTVKKRKSDNRKTNIENRKEAISTTISNLEEDTYTAICAFFHASFDIELAMPIGITTSKKNTSGCVTKFPIIPFLSLGFG